MVLRGLLSLFAGEKRFAQRKKPLDWLVGRQRSHVLQSQVTLLDIDTNRHVNHAAIIYSAEIARWSFLGETGMSQFKDKWVFMVGSQSAKYKKEMFWRMKYNVLTDLDAIDNKWFYVTHNFMDQKNEAMHAQVLVKFIILKNGKFVEPAEALREIGYTEEVISEIPRVEQDALTAAHVNWDNESYKSMKEKTAKYSSKL